MVPFILFFHDLEMENQFKGQGEGGDLTLVLAAP